MNKNTKYMPLTNEIVGETKWQTAQRAAMKESKVVPSHKGDKMFRLSERAVLKA